MKGKLDGEDGRPGGFCTRASAYGKGNMLASYLPCSRSLVALSPSVAAAAMMIIEGKPAEPVRQPIAPDPSPGPATTAIVHGSGKGGVKGSADSGVSSQ